MYSDNKLVLHLLSLMKQHDILRVVVSPGSRHYPLVRSMEADSDFIMYSVVDERSAAFFALGLIQQTGKRVAICCTSGTSAINYGSAVVEAFYQGLPLVVLTADRLPELLNQKEEQMFRQHDVYDGFIRYQGQLTEAKDRLSEWYCNRIINEAFLEIDHYGKGPVHLNISIESHHTDQFSTCALPVVRKITRVTADDDDSVWQSYVDQLDGKKVLIVWGQSMPMDSRLEEVVTGFSEKHDCVILADKLSNCHVTKTIEMGFLALHAMSLHQAAALAPDIVISLFGNSTFNAQLKSYLSSINKTIDVWNIGRGTVVDPFKRLTTLFETKETYFFERMCELARTTHCSDYYKAWAIVDNSIVEPEVPFGEIYAVGRLLRKLPAKAYLHIANSLPIRMAHLFRSDPSISVYCNRGVNGIDGCMSSAVGFAAATSEHVFLVIGDLTFFYDMNALWNRHLSHNLRILLLNNAGGGVMHMPLSEDLATELTRHVSAGHCSSAKGWVESLGIRYISARNVEECDSAIEVLTDPCQSGPILIEAFSVKEFDVRELKKYFRNLDSVTFSEKVKRKIKRRLPKSVRWS